MSAAEDDLSASVIRPLLSTRRPLAAFAADVYAGLASPPLQALSPEVRGPLPGWSHDAGPAPRPLISRPTLPQPRVQDAVRPVQIAGHRYDDGAGLSSDGHGH